jgi:hypothetical protein
VIDAVSGVLLFPKMQAAAARKIGEPVVPSRQGNGRHDIRSIPASGRDEVAGMGFQRSGTTVGTRGVIDAQDQVAAGRCHIK